MNMSENKIRKYIRKAMTNCDLRLGLISIKSAEKRWVQQIPHSKHFQQIGRI